MPNITHQSNTYKLTDYKSLERSNIGSYISNVFTGDIYKDTERYLRFNHSRDGLVVNDINAIPTGHTAEEQEKSRENLENVLETLIVEPGLICAADKAQEQTYLGSYTQTHINYQDKTYMCDKPHEEFIYSFSTGSDDSFTFTTLRKEVMSKLMIIGDTTGILLGENGEIKEYDLGEPPPDEKPIYTFTDKTDVTFRWLDLDAIKTKVDNQPKASSLDGFNGFSADLTNGNEKLLEENFKKMTTLLDELKGVKTIDGLTNYITENCFAVKGYGKSLKEGLDEKRESGEFSLYFKKEDMAVVGAKEVDASELTPQGKVLGEAPTSAEGEEVPVAVALVEAAPAAALKIEEPKFISKEEAAKLKENEQEDKFIEFKFMKDENGVVLPLFFLNENLTRENHLRMSPKGKIQMAFQDVIKRETYFQIDDRLDFVNKEFGIKKEGKKAVGLDSVSDKPFYSDVAHIAKTIELICNVSEKHCDEKPLLLGDPDDQIKKQIEDRLEYKVEPIMAKPEFKQDLAAIHTLSESLAKVSSVLGARGADKTPELKAKVDEKIKTLEAYKNQIKEQIENRLVDQVEPIMAKPEFKQDLAAIHRMSETLVGISDVLKARGAGENPELKAKVDEKIKTLETYKILNNDISSNKAHKNKWYASALIFAAVTAVAIVVTFPPALAVLAVVVPVVCTVVSLASAYKGYAYQKKESKSEVALKKHSGGESKAETALEGFSGGKSNGPKDAVSEGEELCLSSENAAAPVESGLLNQCPNKGLGQEQLNNTRLGFIPENSSGNSDDPPKP